MSITSPLVQPSPNGRRVGIRIVTFEACSGFTRVTAHRIAQPPKATFVTRLRPFRSPSQAARQLPDQSTIFWVDSSSTGNSRLRGALPLLDVKWGQSPCDTVPVAAAILVVERHAEVVEPDQAAVGDRVAGDPRVPPVRRKGAWRSRSPSAFPAAASSSLRARRAARREESGGPDKLAI